MVKWVIDGVIKADAEKVDSEIKTIGDKVTPSDLLEYAKKNEDSELHKCFEWDDSVAAEKYRLSQATKILQFIVEVPEQEKEPVIREYSITSEKNTYSTTRSFLLNKDEYTNLLQRAKAELNAIKRRYKNLSELETVFAAIDEL